MYQQWIPINPKGNHIPDKEIHSSKQRNIISINDFITEAESNDNYYFDLFLNVCYTSVAKRMPLSPTDHKHSFIETINTFMPHWTPAHKDNVVYATIDETLSSSIMDIEAYLLKLKRELHIGEQGYPSQVTIAGDQQTYALIYKGSIQVITRGL